MTKICLLTFAVIGFAGCGLCGEEAGPETKSPFGEYAAALFIRNCGATTPYVSHINLRNTSGGFKSDSYGTINESEVFVVRGKPNIKVTWLERKRLSIECLECQEFDISKKESCWKDINISYKIGSMPEGPNGIQ